jgi:hypothetical protein
MFQKTNILTYNLAITQLFAFLRYEVETDKMAGQRIHEGNLYFLHQICGQTTTRLDPHSIFSPIVKKKKQKKNKKKTK